MMEDGYGNSKKRHYIEKIGVVGHLDLAERQMTRRRSGKGLYNVLSESFKGEIHSMVTHTYIHKYRQTCVHTHAIIHAYIYTCAHYTFLHAHIHAHIKHTHVHACIHNAHIHT